jgi:divalent metal cation (Fe/Co/Zn/Cd) transporter
LAVVAILLARESGALLVGERTNRKKVIRIRKIITADPSVEAVNDLLTMQLGPDQVLLNVDIKFRSNLTVPELESAIERLESKIRADEPTVQRIFIEAHAWRRGKRSSKPAA